MTLNGINGIKAQTGQFGMNQGTDSYTQNIKKQISNLQKQLQELSSNEEITMEEKQKKRQEINQEINNLNNQLRQHQIEQRREKQQAKNNSPMDDVDQSDNRLQKNAEGKPAGMSGARMQALISADTSMQQVQVQSKVKTHMEGQTGVLKAEIKLDGLVGGNTEAKEEKLAKLEDRVNDLTSDQMSILSDINKNLTKAVKEDHKAEETAEKKDKEVKQDARMAVEEDKREAALGEDKSRKTGLLTGYSPVDIRL